MVREDPNRTRLALARRARTAFSQRRRQRSLPPHGLTIGALADLAEMYPTYLADIERGRGSPTLSKLISLAGALGLPSTN